MLYLVYFDSDWHNSSGARWRAEAQLADHVEAFRQPDRFDLVRVEEVTLGRGWAVRDHITDVDGVLRYQLVGGEPTPHRTPAGTRLSEVA